MPNPGEAPQWFGEMAGKYLLNARRLITSVQRTSDRAAM
ncbi:hypothetical protein J2R80_006111 [Bradyrhizobium sp. USDA 4541]|nr:hypothetical protein [Bradyrhizobium sp. USDA 4541]